MVQVAWFKLGAASPNTLWSTWLKNYIFPMHTFGYIMYVGYSSRAVPTHSSTSAWELACFPDSGLFCTVVALAAALYLHGISNRAHCNEPCWMIWELRRMLNAKKWETVRELFASKRNTSAKHPSLPASYGRVWYWQQREWPRTGSRNDVYITTLNKGNRRPLKISLGEFWSVVKRFYF